MAHQDAGTPRVFLARHGQTEWSKTGRWTGITDLPLTQAGEGQVTSSARILIGPGKLIDPAKVIKVFASPRQRALKTCDLMFKFDGAADGFLDIANILIVTEDLTEWNYGDYEGLKTGDIRKLREERGLDGKGWDHFRDGCEGGETPAQVTSRVDRLIKQIREMQKPNMHGEKASDIVLVAHGHILRGFARRWLGYPMDFPLSAMLEPGGIGILSYQHHNIEEPAFLLGMAVPE